MKWIKLTKHESRRHVWVNLDLIVEMAPLVNGATKLLSGHIAADSEAIVYHQIQVQETPTQILSIYYDIIREALE